MKASKASDGENTINLAPTWDTVLCQVVPMLLESGHRDGALQILKEAAWKLDWLMDPLVRPPSMPTNKKEGGNEN